MFRIIHPITLVVSYEYPLAGAAYLLLICLMLMPTLNTECHFELPIFGSIFVNGVLMVAVLCGIRLYRQDSLPPYFVGVTGCYDHPPTVVGP